jgi:hypothetical protein
VNDQTILTATQNKDKPKKGVLPAELMDNGRYLAARTVGDAWISYPWEAMYVSDMLKLPANKTLRRSLADNLTSRNIDEHDKMASSIND